MNAALFYQPRGRCTFGIAFACAAAIHLGAVVLGKNKSDSTAVQDFRPAPADVEVITEEPQRMLPEQSVSPPPLDQLHPEDLFVEENRMQAPVRAHNKRRAPSLLKGAAAPFASFKAQIMYAPRPVYPYEARRQQLTGSGTAVLTVDPSDGEVTAVQMSQSCGSFILDNATIEALRKWRFKRGTATIVRVPITYGLMGALY